MLDLRIYRQEGHKRRARKGEDEEGENVMKIKPIEGDRKKREYERREEGHL